MKCESGEFWTKGNIVETGNHPGWRADRVLELVQGSVCKAEREMSTVVFDSQQQTSNRDHAEGNILYQQAAHVTAEHRRERCVYSSILTSNWQLADDQHIQHTYNHVKYVYAIDLSHTYECEIHVVTFS